MINKFPAGKLWDEYDKALTEIEELRSRAEAAEKEVADLVSVIQRYQPAGSPPPGGSFILVDWVLSSLQQRAEAAEARVRELDLLLREAIGGAAWESCEYKDYEIAIPTWNCCDWSEWVREVAEKLGIKLP